MTATPVGINGLGTKILWAEGEWRDRERVCVYQKNWAFTEWPLSFSERKREREREIQ
tara:strand:- start:153 stop:323 length:171 start_codon:yes stop_codon:yes gene_type:complete